jgi:uncharacterized protein
MLQTKRCQSLSLRGDENNLYFTERGMSNTNLHLPNVKLERGTRVRSSIPILEFVDGAPLDVPVMVVSGSKPGPTFYLGSAFHGDEVNGVHIVARLAREIDVRELSGTLVIVPAQNPSALRMQHRYALGHLINSPMDQSPADPWASFPGDEHGTMASRLAYRLYNDLMQHADYIVDVHTPTTGGRYAPFSFLPPVNVGSIVEESEKMAKAFGADFVLATNDGVYVQECSPHTVMARKGKIALGLEVGEGGILSADVTDRGLRGIKNMLRSVGMLAGPLEEMGRKIVVSSMTIIRTTRGGLLNREVELNDAVKQGQLLATVSNLFGEIIEEIRAPHDGPIVRVTTFPAVESGERVIQIGVPR